MSENATLSLNISDQKIEQLVQAELKARVLATLSAKSELIMAQLVGRVLDSKVDENGKTASYGTYNKYPLIDKLFELTLQDTIREAIKEYVEAQRPRLKAEIEKHIKARPASLAKAIVEASANTLAGQYLKAEVSVTFRSKA